MTKKNGTDYLITVDSYSDWFELNTLNTGTTSKIVIQKLKAHFCQDLEYQTKCLQMMFPCIRVQNLKNFLKNGVIYTKPAALDILKATVLSRELSKPLKDCWVNANVMELILI